MSLSSQRATAETAGVYREFPVAAGVNIFQGALVMLLAGNAQPGAVAVNGLGLGRAEWNADNVGGAAGAINIKVKRGVFKYLNCATDLIPASQFGQNCYIFDDQTVAATNGGATRSVAGVVHQIDSDGVWVRF